MNYHYYKPTKQSKCHITRNKTNGTEYIQTLCGKYLDTRDLEEIHDPNEIDRFHIFCIHCLNIKVMEGID